MPFDVASARREGYSDAEIAGFLASRSRFDLEGARKEGYDDSDIVAFLTRPAPPTAAEVAQAERPARMTLTRGGQSMLAPSTPAPPASTETVGDFMIENVGGPLVRGVEALQRESAMLTLLKNAKLLEVYNAIDRGETPKEAADPLAYPFKYRSLSAEQRAVRRADAERRVSQSIAEVAERTKTMAGMPGDPDVAKALNADTIEEFWDAFKKKPLKFIANVGLESLPQMVPGIAMAIPGGLVAGVPGAAAGMGAGSGVVDYAASTMEALARRKVDLTDEAAIKKAIADPALIEEVKVAAFKHAVPVALFDAASVTALARRLGGNFVTRMMKQLGIQATLGAGGEAIGQVAAQEGYQPGQVVAEAAGELAQAPVEALTVAAVNAARAREARQATQAAADTEAVSRVVGAQSVDEAIAAADKATRPSAMPAAPIPERVPVAASLPATVEAIAPAVPTPAQVEPGSPAAELQAPVAEVVAEPIAREVSEVAGEAQRAPLPGPVPTAEPSEEVRILGKPVSELTEPELRIGARNAATVEQRQAAAEEIVRRSQAASTETAPKTAMQIAFERAQAALRERQATTAAEAEATVPQAAQPVPGAASEEAPGATGEMPYIRGIPAEDVPLRQLEVMVKAGNPEIRTAAEAELQRREAMPAGGEQGRETMSLRPTTPARAREGEIGPATDVRIFGQPLEQLTEKELGVAARAHRMSAFRESARMEIERRSEARGVVEPAMQAPEGIKAAPSAPAPSQAAPRGSAEPILILGKAPAELPQRTLEFVAKAGNPALKAAATAELERRASVGTSRAPVAPETSRAGGEAPVEGESREAVGIALTPPYTGTEAEAVADLKGARPDAIRQAIRDLFNVPINEGGFKGSRDKLGIYKIKPRTIRIRNQNDIAVITHELGHHISETSQPIREARKAFDAELRAITPYVAQQKTPALQREEGMAEFVRLYLTEPAQAAAKAPDFFAAFDEYVGEHGLKPALHDIGQRIWDWQRLPPADRILAKVGEDQPEFRKRWNVDRVIFEVFDRWLPMKRMVEDLKPDIAPSADPFKLAHLLSGDSALIEDWLLRESVPFDFTRRANVEDRGKPLAEILKPIEDQEREFGAYLIAKRANELMKRGKEHLYSADEIAAGLRLETPEFKQAAKEIYEFQDQLLQYAVEGGLLNQYIADKFRQFPFYVPFFRVGEPIARRGDIFKQIRGGTENLRDPIANVIENTVRVIHATNRNFVLAKAHDLARLVPGGGRWLENVPMPERAVKLETQKVIDQLREQGVEIDASTAEAIATTQTFFVKNPFGDERERIIVIRRSGRPRALQVNDEMLWHALERFEPVDMGLVEKVLSVPADILRAGIVLSPEFMARNVARDTLSGFIQSKKGILPVVSTVDGFKEILTRSDAARLYRAFGGAYGDMWRADSGMEHVLVERMAKHGGFDPRTIITPRGLLSLLYRLGSLTEAGTRVAEFKKTMKGGDIDSLIDAAYNAREVSVDFGMHGHSRTIRFLTRITVFMNPALQGWYKAARTAKTQPLATVFRGGVLAAASILLYLNNRDKDWYDELEQWERNTYWHLDIGLRDPQGQVIPLRIPKPWELGGFFGSIPEALAEVSIKQHGERFAKRLASIVDDVFTFRVIPSAILLPAELWGNRNTFSNRPIVPESKEKLAPELQATPGTSLTAKKIGALTDTSPAKIDHAVRGLFGTLGTYSIMLADQAIRLDQSEPKHLPIPWQRAPVVRAFFSDPSGANSRYVSEFYDLLREARRADQSLKYMPPERMDEYYRKHQREIENSRSAETVSRMMARLRRDNEQIRESRDMPDAERMRIIAENNRAIRWMARDYMKDQERAAAGAR